MTFCKYGLIVAFALAFSVEGKTEMMEMTYADSINRAKQHLSFGTRYLKIKQYEDAEAQFLKSWGYNPKRSVTARYLGKLYEELGEYENAQKWYQKAIELDPKSKYNQIAHIAMARIYLIQKQPQKAIEHYEALLAFRLGLKEKIQYYHALVSLGVETEDYKKALEYAIKWSELTPNDPEVQDLKASLYLRRWGEWVSDDPEKEKQLQEALWDFALSLDPCSKEHDELIWVLTFITDKIRSGDDRQSFLRWEKLRYQVAVRNNHCPEP